MGFVALLADAAPVANGGPSLETVLIDLLQNSPIAVALIVVVMLFLKFMKARDEQFNAKFVEIHKDYLVALERNSKAFDAVALIVGKCQTHTEGA